MLQHKKNKTTCHIGSSIATCLVVVLACATPFTASAAVSAKSTLGTGLVGHWTFDESRGATAGDHSGNGNTGTLTNNPLWTTGRLGSGMQFDGTSQYVNVGPLSQTQGQATLTLASWVKPISFSTYAGIITKNPSSPSSGYGLAFGGPSVGDSTAVSAVMRNGSDAYGWTASNLIPLNKWSYIVMVFDGTQTGNANRLKVYINGVQATLTFNGGTIAATTPTNSVDAIIGRTDPSYYFNGSLDDVRIYNRALSATEVTALYQLGSTKIATATQTGNDVLDGLVGYWGLDEGTGTTAADGSINGKTGTLTGGPTWVTGRRGNAVSFDGVDDIITIPPINPSLAGNMAVSAWINPTTFTNAFSGSRIVSNSTSATRGYAFGLDATGKPTFEISATCADPTVSVTATVAVPLNKWSFVSAQYVGGTSLAVYINGVQVGINTTSIPSTQCNNPSFASSLGRRNDVWMMPFAGLIDDVRIYNRALSAGEIQKLYNIGSDASLVGHWTFDGKDITGTTALDKSSRGNNGTLTNGPTVTPGKLGQGLSFDGVDDSVNFGTSSVLSPSVITMSAWVNADTWANTSGRSGILIKGGSVYLTVTPSGFVEVYGYGKSNQGYHSSTAVLSTGRWYYLTLVIDSSGFFIYIDGVLDKYIASTGGLSSSAYNTRIGAEWDGSGRFFKGRIDDARVYNRALSASEIRSLYDLGSADKINSSVAAPQGTGRLDSGLVGYWKLDDATGTTAADASGNANTGTLTNGPTWTTGKVGGGVVLNGTNQYIKPSTDSIPSTGPSTLSAWIYTTDATANQVIVGKQCYWGCTSHGYGLYLTSGYLVGRADNPNTPTSDWLNNLRTPISANTWHHVIFTITGMGSNQMGKLYVDGVEMDSFIGTSALYNYEFAIGAGASGASYSFPFKGKIDDVRIYNRALSDDEVRQLYNLGNGVNTGTDPSLVGYWSFNGPDMSATTAYDRSGRGNNGTLTNGPTVTPGKLGQGLSFNGTSQYVTVAHASHLNAFPISIGIWFKTTVTGGSQYAMVNKYLPSSSNGYNFHFMNGNVCAWYFGASGNIFNGTNCPFSIGGFNDGNWHHGVFVVDLNSGRMYIDGVLRGTQIWSGTPSAPSSTTNLSIGYYSGGSLFPGSLDDVRIYNRALSAAEVLKLYNNGR